MHVPIHELGRMTVKILDGGTYTIIERASAPGRRDYAWVGDNGQEIGLTDEVVAELL